MNEENKKNNTEVKETPEAAVKAAPVAAPTATAPSVAATSGEKKPQAPGAFDARPPRMKNSRDSRPRRGGPRGADRVKPEFDTKMIDIRRVTRVAAGGRRFTFSVAVVSGDRKGRVGVGLGKSIDTTSAIDKATRDAKKHMVKLTLTPSMSIPHSVYAKYSSARVEMMPVKGRGLVAGSAVRNVLVLAGVKDVVAKLRSPSKNKLNIARATVEALGQLSKLPRPGAKIAVVAAAKPTAAIPASK
ncbi:MAG: 30S ribosomal protein S5 [Candidatus Pacebacteria bacterium]|nr:30S ribosomal protein S5 [Candidatus Paceibacterota bacterium]